MATLGVPPAEIAAHQAHKAELRRKEALAQQANQAALLAAGPEQAGDSYEIWPWHVDALRVFDFMQTQVRVVAGFAGLLWLGLDHSAFPQAFAALELPCGQQAELRRQVRVMEDVARKLLNRLKG